MRAGPKAEITAEPLDLSHLPASDGERVMRGREERVADDAADIGIRFWGAV